MKRPGRQRVQAWLTLLRMPNLLTVPGDPLAGYLLAGMEGGPATAWIAVRVALAALLLYAAGLIANDVVDIDEDRRLRPERPLPSGALTSRHAVLAAAGCAGAGLLLAFTLGLLPGVMALLLLLCIVFYTFAGKSLPVIGPLWMGACRAFSLLLGAAAADRFPALDPPGIAALGLLFYVAALTALARHETRTQHPGILVWLPFAALVLTLSWIFSLSIVSFRAQFLAGIALLAALAAVVKSYRAPLATRAVVGGLIRGILLFQAVLLSLSPPPGPRLALLPLLAWPLHRFLSRRFPPT